MQSDRGLKPLVMHRSGHKSAQKGGCMNKRLLMAGMARAGLNKGDLAGRLGVAPKTISERFKLWDWRLSECRAIKDILSLSADEVVDIFFTNDVTSEATIEEGM